MADQPKTGPMPVAPDAALQPNKPTTDAKPAAAPIVAATAPVESMKN